MGRLNDNILNEMRFFNKHGKTKSNVYESCFSLLLATRNFINESKNVDTELTKEIIDKIRNNDYVVNDYDSFFEGLYLGKRRPFLSRYTKEDFENDNVRTFQIEGYPIGFALKPQPNGGMDIISVHNNVPSVGGIGKELIMSAIANGGNMLDHFDGYLSDLYQSMGFEEYGRDSWNPDYAPEDWDDEIVDGKSCRELYGEPDVVYRKLKNN